MNVPVVLTETETWAGFFGCWQQREIAKMKYDQVIGVFEPPALRSELVG